MMSSSRPFVIFMSESQGYREFTDGGLVEGGLAMYVLKTSQIAKPPFTKPPLNSRKEDEAFRSGQVGAPGPAAAAFAPPERPAASPECGGRAFSPSPPPSPSASVSLPLRVLSVSLSLCLSASLSLSLSISPSASTGVLQG